LIPAWVMMSLQVQRCRKGWIALADPNAALPEMLAAL
jgi:hypothetical protein